MEPVPPVTDDEMFSAEPIHAGPALIEEIITSGVTVTTCVAIPQLCVYSIVVVPDVRPVTTPVVALTVPTTVLVLLHVQKAAECSKLTALVGHTVKVPVMRPGLDPVKVIFTPGVACA